MAKRQMDPLDAGLTVLTLMTSFIMVGIAHFDLFDLEFGATLVSLSGFEFSLAWVLGAGALVATVATNDNQALTDLPDDVQDLEPLYYGAVVGTAALMIGWVVLPDLVAEFFRSADMWGVLFVGMATIGQFALGWML